MGSDDIRCAGYLLGELSLNNEQGESTVRQGESSSGNLYKERGKKALSRTSPQTAVLKKSWQCQLLPITGIWLWPQEWAGSRTPTVLSHQLSTAWERCGLGTRVLDIQMGGIWTSCPPAMLPTASSLGNLSGTFLWLPHEGQKGIAESNAQYRILCGYSFHHRLPTWPLEIMCVAQSRK